MGWRDRYGLKRLRGPRKAKFDRKANDTDIEALIAFAKSRIGVEFYVEPETFATDTTAVAVARDGEWTRRRVGSPKVIAKVAKDLALPVYDVQITGYPASMRAYNERRKQDNQSL
ncbi:hypothetical protein [Rhizohabitans arisaemae]|uniref:hypothetical protein n=1 Tax=Rhizohabitans arisaemae TaxID=2720610 RepID=UPI0024B270B4|nr:hypothetical protein [Rhizohabitans arisaemae]